VLWQKNIDDQNADRLFTNPALVGDTVLIAPLLAENAIYALNVSDGSVRWFFKPQ
jgi:outer membrane protein assembly factor BamB